MEPETYISINKNLWNQRTEWHVKSGFYAMDDFLKGKNSLNGPELALLGNIQGLSILHLQCHFGQDTISLSRMGADATGVDLSDVAIAHAVKIAADVGADTKFICSDIYDLPQHLTKQFDIVFTSYGTIGWLPDLDKWANIVHQFLKPGGRFIFAEFHPVMWMFDNMFTKVAYSYFTSEPIVETENGTYADKSAPIQTTSMSWNHGLAEVFNSLQQQGMEPVSFNELDYSPYNCFSNMEEVETGKFMIRGLEHKLPVMYTFCMKKPG